MMSIPPKTHIDLELWTNDNESTIASIFLASILFRGVDGGTPMSWLVSHYQTTKLGNREASFLEVIGCLQRYYKHQPFANTKSNIERYRINMYVVP